MSFHDEVLSEAQRSILPALAAFSTANGFYLGGGTAVALHLGHRRSVDFDWFARTPIDDPLVLAELARRADLPLENARIARGTLHGVVKGVQVSFFEYPYPDIGSPGKWPEFSVELASLDDLACMKLAAIAQRGARKDFVDIYAIALEHKPIEELLALYRRKYSVDDIGHVLVGLTYFDDADEEPEPMMLRDLSWEEIKRQLRRWIRALAG
ncbi:MAG: nucleotidyl transferase AbiEii/AbiGii toxin family protein [Armatimonadetes bacterium]|nr:nucleotidyl transferase AbiEii/AbiGii toxin family protein [Armatimonadota bacterium]